MRYRSFKNKNKKTRKRRINKILTPKLKTYSKKDYESTDGMLTSVWGPSLWHTLHTISFNYPIYPSKEDKKNYKKFMIGLKNVLPCRYCRENYVKNIKQHPLEMKDLKNRETFSRWVYELHELINKMLKKESKLSYDDVRERYEHFRSRCTLDDKKNTKKGRKRLKTRKNKKEKGCIEPLYGKKSKCIIKIVPKELKIPSFQMDEECKKKRIQYIKNN